MSDTAIEWTDKVWNPTTGCTKVSQGCKHCYAERVFPRPYPGRAFTDVRTHPDRLEQPLRWAKPQRIFVNSMSDLFHEDVSEDFIRAVFMTMGRASHHTFQVLTKRPERMRDMLCRWHVNGMTLREGCGVALPNVWLGVSIEDQATADERIPVLLHTPAAVRFLSCEPLLGPVDLRSLRPSWCASKIDCLSGVETTGTLLRIDVPTVSWVIAGGESGPKARPMHPDWARSLRDQCEAAGVPFFFKQWGEWRPPLADESYSTAKGLAGKPPAFIVAPDGTVHCFHSEWNRGGAPMIRVGKRAAGRLLDGREHSEFPSDG